MTAIVELVDRMPKAELHCHVFGAIRPQTLQDLAAKNGVEAPDYVIRSVQDGRWKFEDFYSFINTFRFASQVAREAEDFSRLIQEVLADGKEKSNIRHAEFFFNPDYFDPTLVSYETVLQGLVDGAEKAEQTLGVSALLIPSIDRGLTKPSEATDLVQTVLNHPHEKVVGIGIDGPERDGPPAGFAEAFALARQGGLKTTAHVCEDYQTPEEAPPENYAICRDVLGCTRFDHGYLIVHDEAMMVRAAREGGYFTVCIIPSVASRLPSRLERIQTMFRAGLRLTINSDDPAFFETDLAECYRTLFTRTDFGVQEARQFCLNGISGSWLSERKRSALLDHFANDFDALAAELGFDVSPGISP